MVYTCVDHGHVKSLGFEKPETMNANRVMHNIRNAFERSGMTLNELGEGLGYDGPTAKKRAWLLLYRHVRPAHFDSASCRSNAACQDKRSSEMTTRPSPAHCLS